MSVIKQTAEKIHRVVKYLCSQNVVPKTRVQGTTYIYYWTLPGDISLIEMQVVNEVQKIKVGSRTKNIPVRPLSLTVKMKGTMNTRFVKKRGWYTICTKTL